MRNPVNGAARLRRPRVSRTKTSDARSGTTVDRVVSALVDHIRRHKLRAGAGLPSEVQTSADLQVSRGAAREAYRTLSSAGVVDIANGRAPRVGAINNRALLQVVQHALWTDQTTAEQILELRKTIEERGAELACVHRTDDDIAQLRRSVAHMRAAGSKVEPYVKADIHFHEVLGRATGNALFGLVTSALREAMGASIRVSRAGKRSRAELNRATTVHARIADAIERRRPREARQMLVRHYNVASLAVRRQALASGRSARRS